MKKFFEDPSIECIRLETETITDSSFGGSTGTGTIPGDAED